ncbi:hypothetical protein [Maricaulis sp.]|uniref:hypothetical protein n=1 Tax=Maricaulis sp. TaxID=1486257 RepID=UPI003A902AB6
MRRKTITPEQRAVIYVVAAGAVGFLLIAILSLVVDGLAEHILIVFYVIVALTLGGAYLARRLAAGPKD